jgi:hypothetical protein
MTEETTTPAVPNRTAGWVITLENAETNQRFTTTLGSPRSDVMPTPEEAFRLAPAFRLLAQRARDMTTRLTDICVSDLTERNATERRVDGRLYKVERDSEWSGEWPTMREALVELVATGDLTQDEVDEALPVIVTKAIKPNNTRLNSLEKKRGGKVAVAIGKSRRRTDGSARIVEVT